MKPKVFQVTVGQTVWAEPTGNRARRWDGTLYECTVTKIGKKYIHVQEKDNKLDSFRIDKETMVGIDRDENSGYNLWESLADYLAAARRNQHLQDFRRVFTTAQVYENIPAATIGKIYRLLVECGTLQDDGCLAGRESKPIADDS